MYSRTQSILRVSTILLVVTASGGALAQDKATEKTPPSKTGKPPADVPKKVDVVPEADDSDIESRLTRILKATGWYKDVQVRVDEGIVYLNGTTESTEHKDWAGKLASQTQDVVAVVNRIEPKRRSAWDLTPAWQQAKQWGVTAFQAIPVILLSIGILILTWIAARIAKTIARSFVLSRVDSPLLKQVVANVVAVPVIILGVYLVLKISGLTGLAATIVGGTGLFGLVVGIAFRDIAENFLASVLISVQRPFQAGDLIEVDKYKGFVQRVTTRGTLLMTFDGNHVQVPNSVIYKSTITNFTSNPNVRLGFVVGIGYDDSVSKAQTIAVEKMKEHPAVLSDPEPVALVDELGAATVNLQMYCWTDGHDHSAVKVKSAVIRMVKRAFEKAGISMPDESREIVFPQGVPVAMHSDEPSTNGQPKPVDNEREQDDDVVSDAEGGLHSEAGEINEQARRSRDPEDGANLLEQEPSNTKSAATAA